MAGTQGLPFAMKKSTRDAWLIREVKGHAKKKTKHMSIHHRLVRRMIETKEEP
jgi:hypothetical protein